MSVRDLVWLRAARGIREKEESDFKLKRYENDVKFKLECLKQIRNLLKDIRQCVFWNAEFDTTKDPLAFDKAWLSLPSMEEAGYKPEDAIAQTMSKKDREAYWNRRNREIEEHNRKRNEQEG